MKKEIPQRQIGRHSAASILQRTLGGDRKRWNRFLHNQLILEHPCNGQEIPVGGTLKDPTYLEADLYKYVFQNAPLQLGFGEALGIGTVDGSSFSCTASVAVDYEHAGTLVVNIEGKWHYGGYPWISTDAARALATELLEAADACESNAFDVARWSVVPKNEVSVIPAIQPGQDIELQLLLTQLG